MNHVVDRFDGYEEEADGFYQSPGAVHSFIEGEKTYLFTIEDSMPTYAVVKNAIISGHKVSVMLNEPKGETPSVIKLPMGCSVFSRALKELRLLGVKELAVYNQVTGAYSNVQI